PVSLDRVLEAYRRATLVSFALLGRCRRAARSIRLRWWDYWLKGIDNGVLPAGKRLVIEYASGEAFAPTGQKCLFSVLTSLAGQPVSTRHYLESTPLGKFGAQDYFRAGQVVRHR